MKISTLVIPCICAVLLLALVLPAGADDTSQVTVTPTATIAAAQPSFDPFGSFLGIIGLRHEDQNLTQDIHANDQEIHQNWWDSLNIFQNILGNRATVRSDQEADLANRTENIGYREDIHADRIDIRNDTGNKTEEEQQIVQYHSDIHQDWQDINATHQDIHEERNASAQDWSDINANHQQDITLRQTNGADWEQVHDNRQQIREDRGNATSSS